VRKPPPTPLPPTDAERRNLGYCRLNVVDQASNPFIVVLDARYNSQGQINTLEVYTPANTYPPLLSFMVLIRDSSRIRMEQATHTTVPDRSYRRQHGRRNVPVLCLLHRDMLRSRMLWSSGRLALSGAGRVHGNAAIESVPTEGRDSTTRIKCTDRRCIAPRRATTVEISCGC